MKKYNTEDLVLLIDKKGDKDKFVIVERKVKDKFYKDKFYNDKYYLIFNGNENHEILDKFNYVILGADSTYFERDDFFFTELDIVLTANFLNWSFLKYEKLDMNNGVLSRDIFEDTKKYLQEYINRKHFKGEIPKELTISNIKYIEDKLNFELKNINNMILEEEM